MSVWPETIERARRAARRRARANALLPWLPALAGLCVLARLQLGWLAAVNLAVIGLALLTVLGHRAGRRIDDRWLLRRLDGSFPELEDSAALLLTPVDAGLAGLQRRRVETRLATLALPEWREPWARARFLVGLGVGLLVWVAAWWPQPVPSQKTGAVSVDLAAPMAPALISASLEVVAPAYTGLAPQREDSLDARVPQDARLTWHLRFEPAPASASLAFHDGARLALERQGQDWVASTTLARPALYRILGDDGKSLGDERLHRLDVIADAAPEIQVIAPDKTLSLLTEGQKTWALAFEASDDYGLGEARLAITLAQGSGENISFKEQTRVLTGEGDARHKRYREILDLAGLGLAQGDDVVVRLSVSDNRRPEANTTRSASFILRWPPEASTDSAAMDGVVQKTLPTYFRSQRQIIIDTEALVAAEPALSAEQFEARSDNLGVEQKILRLRYGQFLGEEFETKVGEGAGEHGGQADQDATSGDAAKVDTHGKSKETPEERRPSEALRALPADHDHEAPVAGFGSDAGIMAEYGHTHDHAEAATLLDPETKAILKKALGEMWQAELMLRTTRPKDALPFEYKALEYIKQVQQASRIYLARVGLELPAIDETRRLSGDRSGLVDPVGALAPASVEASPVPAAWAALSAGHEPGAELEAWVRGHERELPDALGLLAALDSLSRQPACEPCRARLMALLWPLLPTPASAVTPRPAPDTAGRAYLRALSTEDAQ